MNEESGKHTHTHERLIVKVRRCEEWGSVTKVKKRWWSTHRCVGLFDEFALPHLQAPLSLLQLLFFGAQVSLQLLESVECSFNLTPRVYQRKDQKQCVCPFLKSFHFLCAVYRNISLEERLLDHECAHIFLLLYSTVMNRLADEGLVKPSCLRFTEPSHCLSQVCVSHLRLYRSTKRKYLASLETVWEDTVVCNDQPSFAGLVAVDRWSS